VLNQYDQFTNDWTFKDFEQLAAPMLCGFDS